jgi:hypothetical protein
MGHAEAESSSRAAAAATILADIDRWRETLARNAKDDQ